MKMLRITESVLNSEGNLTENKGILEAELHVQIGKEKQKLHAILMRILHGIKYLV